MNKRGWIHILEATIAVMIVAGVMVSVYSDQSAKEVLSIEDYSYSLQNEILEEIATRSDLRMDAMNVVVDLPGDPAYDILDAFVETKIPEGFGHLLRVCNLGDTNDYCKMPPIIFYATIDKDVFVEDVVISAEIGDGAAAAYSPKKIRLFFWEGGFPVDYCRDECMENRAPLSCSSDSSQVLKRECGNFDSDTCLEYGSNMAVVESCGAGKRCMDGECVFSLFSKLTCKGLPLILMDGDCVSNFDNECDAFDIADDEGSCGTLGTKDEYKCWNYTRVESECLVSPVCPSGYTMESVAPCVCEPVWTPLADSVCSATSFTQNSQCGTTRNAVGTKNCVCVDGTLIGQCSTNKPFNCSSSLQLVPSCSTCGCSSGTCNVATGNCGGVASLSASITMTTTEAFDDGGCYSIAVLKITFQLKPFFDSCRGC